MTEKQLSFKNVIGAFIKIKDKGIVRGTTGNRGSNQSCGNGEKGIDIQQTDLYSPCNTPPSPEQKKASKPKKGTKDQKAHKKKDKESLDSKHQQENEIKALEQLQEQLSKRHELEQHIAKLVSGNTGMVQLLDNLLIQAKNKNQDYFLFYATSFQKKAQELSDCLHHYYQRPMDYVSFKHSTLKKEKEELERLIALPAKNERLYIKLLKADQELQKYIPKDASSISVDAMDSWSNAVLLLDKDQDEFYE